MTYLNFIDNTCKNCNDHTIQMCDADAVASFCKLHHTWCNNIKTCDKRDK